MSEVISLNGGAAGAPILNERAANAAGILPGHLVIEALGKVGVNVTADALCQKLFAQTNKAVAGDVDLAYAADETVSYGAYHAGQPVDVLIAAGAAAIADGDPLTSAGDGTLKVGTVATASAYATKALDNSGSATVARLSARVA